MLSIVLTLFTSFGDMSALAQREATRILCALSKLLALLSVSFWSMKAWLPDSVLSSRSVVLVIALFTAGDTLPAGLSHLISSEGQALQ